MTLRSAVKLTKSAVANRFASQADTTERHRRILRGSRLESSSSALFAFAPYYIERRLQDKKRVFSLNFVDAVSQSVRKAMSHLRDRPAESMKVVLAIVHFVRAVISQTGPERPEYLRSLVVAIDPLKRLPNPAGGAALELFSLLVAELKSPGHALRYRIRVEVPSLDLFLEDLAVQATERGEESPYIAFEKTNLAFCMQMNTLEARLLLNVNALLRDQLKPFTAEELRVILIVNILAGRVTVQQSFALQLVNLSPREHFLSLIHI
eukprot:TRINITY_DN14540_c0_g1_i1.p1 TRINITY_DN14540_c0_g1~~TRINITY_DN14540_c0_g1_i1.p1  ORF type:complete len:265 (-),score=51.46 TRINITY_DN14540_c0_g1_i1:60-854(-)